MGRRKAWGGGDCNRIRDDNRHGVSNRSRGRAKSATAALRSSCGIFILQTCAKSSHFGHTSRAARENLALAECISCQRFLRLGGGGQEEGNPKEYNHPNAIFYRRKKIMRFFID